MSKNLADVARKIEILAEKGNLDAPWYVEKEPHDYNDGTSHFNHVRYNTASGRKVEVASYVTPELGELLCVLHNNLPEIIKSLRTGYLK